MPTRIIKLVCRLARRFYGSPATEIQIRLADGRHWSVGCQPEPPTPRPKTRARTAAPSGAQLVGRDGQKILDAIERGGSIEAKNLPHASGVERSRCYVLVADMTERGLIRDSGDGLVLVNSNPAT